MQYSVSAKSPLGIVFIDLNKAYDRVDRNTLWEDMAKNMHIPPCLISIIRNMYVNNKGIVCMYGQDRSSFPANTGVRQGDGASPKLFNVFFD